MLFTANLKRTLTIFTLVTLTLCFLSSCAKRRAAKQAEEDEQIILDYIDEMGLTASRTEEGLYYVIDQLGTGDYPAVTSNVTVAYTGYFTDGSIFDGSSSSGITFNLQNVIDGWIIGIPKFKEGGNGTLLIPSALGYGPNPTGSIPANSVLIFDVELIDIP